MARKTTFIAPIFKKGNSQLVKNYRPISLACIYSKILEHIVCRHVLNHLESHGLLSDLQHEFRHGHFCETQILTTLQVIMSHYNKKNQINIAVLTKAFDTTLHNRLLGKLCHYSVTINLLSWIASFLKGHKHS